MSVSSVLRFNSTYISVLIIKILIPFYIKFKCSWLSHVLSKIVVTLYNYVTIL